MIKDTEALALEEDMSVPEDPEEETGGSVQGAESSSGALLDEYLLRYALTLMLGFTIWRTLCWLNVRTIKLWISSFCIFAFRPHKE